MRNSLDNSIEFIFLSEPYRTIDVVVIGYAIDYEPFSNQKKTISLPEKLKQYKTLLRVDDCGCLSNHMISLGLLSPVSKSEKYLLIVTNKDDFNQIENIINDITKPQPQYVFA